MDDCNWPMAVKYLICQALAGIAVSCCGNWSLPHTLLVLHDFRFQTLYTHIQFNRFFWEAYKLRRLFQTSDWQQENFSRYFLAWITKSSGPKVLSHDSKYILMHKRFFFLHFVANWHFLNLILVSVLSYAKC